MKLQLSRTSPIGAGLVRLGADQTRDAADQLADVMTDPVRAVHRSRIALKRARSVLRLLEKAGANWALPPRFRLGELARKMSAPREAAAIAGLARLEARRLSGGERDLVLLLATRKARLVPAMSDSVRQALRKEARELADAPAPKITKAELRDLLRRSFNRTKRRYHKAAKKRTLGAVHEWRKAVIVLRDHTSLVARYWPKGAGKAYPLLVRFARELGRRGDIALLLDAVWRLRVSPAHSAAREALIARLERRLERATVAVLRSWPKQERRLAGMLAK